MALPHHLYRDPLEQLIRAEEFKCRGCAHEERKELFGTVIYVCKLKNRDGTPRKHGKRCNRYEGEA